MSRIEISEMSFCEIRQKFDSIKMTNIQDKIEKELESAFNGGDIKSGMSIAVTAGSRGIANIDAIIRDTCHFLMKKGAAPFIVPAMGSHGGATDEGQKNVLEKLNITEKEIKVKIKSSMETELIGYSGDLPVYMDKNAFNSEGIIIVNRIKPHTDFVSNIESGLMKMIAVGLGKKNGAEAIHRHGLKESIPKAAKLALEKAPIILGLAIIENAFDETYDIVAVKPEEFFSREPELLELAKSKMPKLPGDELDVLVVGEMGKIYSGTGMDTKIIGRMMAFGEAEPDKPKINKIAVLSLSDKSYGNALGVGLADVTTERLYKSINFETTYANTIPTTFLERSKIPIIMKDDKAAIELMLNTVGCKKPQEIRAAIIKNTLNLKELWVTEAVMQTLDKDSFEIIRQNIRLEFDEENRLKTI
jgi:inorganic pyrophosphatase